MKKKLVFVFLLSLSGCYCGLLLWINKGPEIGVKQSSFRDAPVEALEINYHYSEARQYLDFKIDRRGFEKWVQEKKFEMGVDPWSGKSYDELDHQKTVWKYNHVTSMIETIDIQEDDIWLAQRQKNGGGYTVAYIIKEGVAIYSWASH